MARSTVELIVNATKALGPLRKVDAASRKLNRAFQLNQQAAKKVAAAYERMGHTGIKAIRDLESNAQRLGRRMGGLRGAVAKVVVGFAAFKTVQAGIERIESERKLRLLSREFGEIAHVQQAAARAAKTFGLSQTEANQGLAKIYARLRPVGIGLADIESTFVGFNTAAKLAGATAGESAGAFLQLSQALGSGFLRGQELNSVLEQAPLIGIAIAKEMGVAVGELKDLGAQGKISSATVIRALKRIEKEGADKLKEAMGGPAQAIKNFQNAVEDVQAAVTKDAMPELTDAFTELANTIRELAPALRFVGGVAAQIFKYIAGLARRINDLQNGGKRAQAEFQAKAQAQQLTRQRFGVAGMFSQEARDFRAQVEKNFMFNFDAQQKAALEAGATSSLPALPKQPLPTSKGGGEQDKKSAAALQRRTKAISDYLFNAQNRLKIETQQDELERVRAEASVARLEAERTYNEMIKGVTDSTLLKNAATARSAELMLVEIQEGKELGEVLDRQGEAQRKAAQAHTESAMALMEFAATKDPLAGLNDMIGITTDSFSQMFLEVFKGTKSAADAFRSMAGSIIDSLGKIAIKAAAEGLIGLITSAFTGGAGAALSGAGALAKSGTGLGVGTSSLGAGIGYGDGAGKALTGMGSLKGLGGFGGFMARGGRTRPGKGYIVGENGPEYFRPGRSGEIVPNHMINLGGKFMPMNPLFLAAMAGVGNFGGRRQEFMNYMIGGRNFGHAMPRANGGPVSAGSNYMVGERGPEMYVPSGGGMMNANIVVNVSGNGGMQTEGEGNDNRRLGEAIGVAVRQELIRQKRPGGLLS